MAWVNAIIQGLLTGGLYALFACGLSLMFGVMKVVNLAHGDLAVVAGYIGVGVIAVTHMPVLWSIPVVVVLMAVIGYILQRSIIQGAISRGELTTLIVTFGLSIIIENGLQQFFTANSRGLGVGDSFVTASFSIGSQITIAYLNLAIFVLAVIVLLGLQQYLSFSKYGRLIRAVADDREAAQLSGADYRHVFGIAAAIAFGTVAIAGIVPGDDHHDQPDHRHRHDPAVRLRLGGHRRPRLAVGHAARRHRPRRRPGGRRADQPVLRDARRVRGLPARPRDPPAGARQPGGCSHDGERDNQHPFGRLPDLRVTRSRRNVAWSGIGALVVIVVLFAVPVLRRAGHHSASWCRG